MSDIPYIEATQEVKIAGQDSSGDQVNYVSADSNGNMLVKDYSNGPVAPGVAASASSLIGGQYNSDTGLSTPLTTGQQSAIQVDANGRLLTSSFDLPTTSSKFSFGEVTTAATTQVSVESTTYTETTTNSTMTIVSSSANDSSAGTGARTVTVTYLDQTGAGPSTTVFIMDGTTPVSASVSTMCFIEKIVVSTVGSGGVSAGTLTLKTGGGTTVGTLTAGFNQTFWAHHYIPIGKICYISGFSIGTNGSAANQSGTFILKATTPTVANTPSIQVSDFIITAGATSSDTRPYASPIQITGPARVTAYVTPGAGSSYTSYASFDFIDN